MPERARADLTARGLRREWRRSGASEQRGGAVEPGAAEGECAGVQAAEIEDDVLETGLSVVGDECLPVPPAALLQDPLGQPRGVAVGIDRGTINIPEEVVGERRHWRQDTEKRED